VLKINKLSYLSNVKTILDVGCGDFNVGRNLLKYYNDVKYLGIDVSKIIISKNKKFESNNIKFERKT